MADRCECINCCRERHEETLIMIALRAESALAVTGHTAREQALQSIAAMARGDVV